jgi:hypothetical protein
MCRQQRPSQGFFCFWIARLGVVGCPQRKGASHQKWRSWHRAQIWWLAPYSPDECTNLPVPGAASFTPRQSLSGVGETRRTPVRLTKQAARAGRTNVVRPLRYKPRSNGFSPSVQR